MNRPENIEMGCPVMRAIKILVSIYYQVSDFDPFEVRLEN